MNTNDDKKFLRNLFNFLDSDSGETLEELKDELKEEGVDFDSAEARLQETFSKLIQKRKTEMQEQDRKQMLEERNKFKQFQKDQDLPKDKKSKWDEINRIYSEYPKLELKVASRNYEKFTNEDLGSILIELRALIKKENSDG